MRITAYVTDQMGKRLEKVSESVMLYKNTDTIEEKHHPGDVEFGLVNIHPDVEYQLFGGMGGAFTDTSATVWDNMPEGKQQEFVRAYFDRENGIGYTLGRLSIGSCDFSAGDYTYVQEGDMTLSSFDISHDKKAIFPLVTAAQEYTALTLFASPWSPPAYMKTDGNRIGGHLKKDCYTLWAKHFGKYIDACKENGIDIWGITIQNEPRHHQIWESCLYTPEEEADFLGYLGKELEGKDIKIFCYDHCRERVYQRAKFILESENGKYCDGIANHWYSGDHFGELKAFSFKYPNKVSIASEGCCAIPGAGIKAEYDLPHAERYAHDLIGCFNNGVTHYCDWNLLLDEENGPYHNREGRGVSAEAPIYYDRTTGQLIYRLSYYYIGHISKFVKPQARVIASSAYSTELESVAFKNTDGSIVCVLLNKTDSPMEAIVRIGHEIESFNLSPHSIMTTVIEQNH